MRTKALPISLNKITAKRSSDHFDLFGNRCNKRGKTRKKLVFTNVKERFGIN